MTDTKWNPKTCVLSVLRFGVWLLRICSVLVCSATFALGIVLEVTRDGVDNKGGPIPLVYIGVWLCLILGQETHARTAALVHLHFSRRVSRTAAHKSA
jgi:hypothetical protein